MTLLHKLLDTAVEQMPNKLSVIAEDSKFTYEQFQQLTVKIALFLKNIGIKHGDRVILLLPNSPILLASTIAVSRIGAIFVILHDETTTYGLTYILNDAKPSLVLTNRALEQEHGISSLHDRVEFIETTISSFVMDNFIQREALQVDEIMGKEPVCLIYTSGSTGQPKAVVSSHDNICFAVKAIQESLRLEHKDVIGNFLPLSFDYGLYQAFLSFEAQATLALGNKEDATFGLVTRLQQWKVTVLPSMPHISAALVRMGNRINPDFRLRVITTTGARHHYSLTEKILELFPECRIYLMYGLTECKRVSILPPEFIHSKKESVGLPLPETDCQVVDKEGNILPPGEIGELIVEGPHVMQGFWREPELTAKKFRDRDGKKVLYTGDLCFKDQDGFLYFYGREDDIYKQKGYRVSTTEIENATEGIDGIYRAAVIVQRNDVEKATLFFEGELSTDDLWRRLPMRLENYKLPSQIIKIRSFPLSSNGKIDKRKLLDNLDSGGLAYVSRNN